MLIKVNGHGLHLNIEGNGGRKVTATQRLSFHSQTVFVYPIRAESQSLHRYSLPCIPNRDALDTYIVIPTYILEEQVTYLGV